MWLCTREYLMFINQSRNSSNVSMVAAAVLLTCSFTSLAQANNDTTFGLGLGLHYSGLGVNAGVHDGENSYLGSVGCVSYSNFGGSTCGVGATWLSSYFFRDTDRADKHATSVYIGIVGSERIVENRQLDYDPIYGAALGYHYFFSGRRNNGFNVGFAFSYGDAKRESDLNALLQVGYQF